MHLATDTNALIHLLSFQVAWAQGVGMKESDLKDCWDVDLGASYIPWDKIPESLDSLAEGGMIDEESLPEHLISMYQIS